MLFFKKHRSTGRQQAAFSRLRSLRCEPLEDRRMLSITLFVNDDATAGGSGLAWGTAYNDLQAALSQAALFNTDSDTTNDVDQIWIAEGTYHPTAELEPGDARSASFSLLDGVDLYGGFAGTETTLAERDLSASHTTILSGDLGTVDDTSDNAYTVVFCGQSIEVSLDGLTITDGNADGSKESSHPERDNGGGIYNNYGVLTLTDVVFVENLASGEFTLYSTRESGGCGGGIYNDHGRLTLTNVMLLDNLANSYSYEWWGGLGGGVYNESGTLTVINSTLSGNEANCLIGGPNGGAKGGGIYNSGGSLTITNSTLSNNSATFLCAGYGGNGGGVYNTGNMNVTDSEFVGNFVIYDTGSTSNAGGGAGGCGGGIFNSGLLAITRSTISDNSAERIGVNVGSSYDGGYGGGIYSDGNMTVTECTVSENSAENGGAILNKLGGMAIVSSVISANTASENGGGIYNGFAHGPYDILEGTATATIMDSTISDNSATYYGGGVYNYAWGHSTDYVAYENFAIMTVMDSTITENTSLYGGGIGNHACVRAYDEDYGGSALATATLAITDSVISSNMARNSGGGIRNDIEYTGSVSGQDGVVTLTVTNSLIADNIAKVYSSYGGGVWNNSDATLINTTLSTNSAGNSGGGIYNTGNLYLENSILANHSPSYLKSGIYNSGMVTLDHSLVWQYNGNELDGSGTVSGSDYLIGQNPLLVDPDNGNYRLSSGSPAVDAGSNSLVPTGVVADLDGNCRIVNGTVDMGAYEVLIIGDANGDGTVDGSDSVILSSNWQAGVNDGQWATWSMGDFNGDGKVDGSDATLLASHWLEGSVLTVAVTSTPEPVSRLELSAETLPGVATVPQRESLLPRVYVTSIHRLSTDKVLAESASSEINFTALAKDIASLSAKKSTAASDALFAKKWDFYWD